MDGLLNLPPELLQHTPWEENRNPIWLASTLFLMRNLSRYPFPAKLTPSQLPSLFDLLSTSLKELEEFKSSSLFPIERLSLLDKEWIAETFLSLENVQPGIKGQGFALDLSRYFLASFNFQNHLELQLMECTTELEEMWARLSKIEDFLGKTLEWAFLPKFGYLTSNPTRCGTALLASCYLHLPALIHTHQLKETMEKLAAEDLEAMGLEGSPEERIGDLVILRNRYTLGITEESIIRSLQTAALRLVAAEKGMRSQLQKKKNEEIRDLISRAYGLLIHSYQLHTKEAFNALSLIKLGIDLGWITGIADDKVNAIFFKCRRAHLVSLLGEKTLELSNISHRRAEFIHRELQGMQLAL